MNRQNIILVASASVATVLAMLAAPALGQLVTPGGQPAPATAISGPSPDVAPQETRVVPESQATMQQSFAPVAPHGAGRRQRLFQRYGEALQLPVCE